MLDKLKKHIPNTITVSRAFIAAIALYMFYIVDIHNYEIGFTGREKSLLLISFILYCIAGFTDALDGALARRWNVTSSFGRNFDPLVDKLLDCGGFIVLALKSSQLTGIEWWMVGIILAREIFITIARTKVEASGKEFGASWAGKVKMTFQSFTVGMIIFYVQFWQGIQYATWFRDFCIYVTVIFTAWTAINYIQRLRKL